MIAQIIDLSFIYDKKKYTSSQKSRKKKNNNKIRRNKAVQL